ncbi:signal recognition particle-docking protein FtsY, partial [Mesorhizobium sp. B2-4-16]
PSLSSDVGKMGAAPKLLISPLAGEMPGRAEGGASRRTYDQEPQSPESLAASYSTKTFTLAARPTASITVSVE